jgi:carboxypeptidase T
MLPSHPHRPGAPSRRALMALCGLGLLVAGCVPGLPVAALPLSVGTTAERIEGSDRFQVAVSAAQKLSSARQASTLFLVPAAPGVESAVAATAAARDGAPILYADATTLRPAISAELVRLHPSRVEIVGSTTGIGTSVAKQVSSLLGPDAVVDRVSGGTPADTAATLSGKAFTTAQMVLVAPSSSFFDALPAAAAAAALDVPLLVTGRDVLSPITADELRRLSPGRVLVVGSTGSISDAVLAKIRETVPDVRRVSGSDRYATAADLARVLFPKAGAVLASLGSDDFGALASIPLAALRGAPLLYLQAGDQLPVATRNELISIGPRYIYIAGPASEINRGELMGFSDGRITVPADDDVHYPTWDSGWHDPGEMETIIKATQVAYPNLVRVFSIGKSWEGRDIWAAKVSDNVAVDEDEPEVMVDALHHAAEHLGVEQALYLLNLLTSAYATDPQVHRLVDSREIWIIFAVNPDGWVYDISDNTYHYWRRNRQHNFNNPNLGVDLNRNYPYEWGCCGGSDERNWAWNYRGPYPLSAPESTAIVHFVRSRVVNGVEQIRTHVTLHTDGEFVLYPWAYSYSHREGMNQTDYQVFVAMARKMAGLSRYTAEQSSVLYPTDGDEIDWMYGTYRIFSFTFELYPTEAQAGTTGIVYPSARVIPKQTARNRAALLYLIDMAACPYAAIGLGAQYCSDAGATAGSSPGDSAAASVPPAVIDVPSG